MLVAKAEYNYYPEEKVIHRQKKNTNKKIKVRKINKGMYLAMAITLLISSLFILFRYAKITETRHEITRLENEVVELQKLRRDLLADLEGLKSTTKISEEASNNLGMIYPDEGQIVYVSVNTDLGIQASNDKLADKIRGILSVFSSVL